MTDPSMLSSTLMQTTAAIMAFSWLILNIASGRYHRAINAGRQPTPITLGARSEIGQGLLCSFFVFIFGVMDLTVPNLREDNPGAYLSLLPIICRICAIASFVAALILVLHATDNLILENIEG